MKASVILLPLLGVTWVLGLFAVNQNTIWFAWLFTIFNSLQVRTFVVSLEPKCQLDLVSKELLMKLACTAHLKVNLTLFFFAGTVHFYLPRPKE